MRAHCVALCLAASVLVVDAAKIEHYVMLLMENRPIDVRPTALHSSSHGVRD